jgi:hypothetical protein
VRYGARLEAIKFVEDAVYGGVGNEVVEVVGFGGLALGLVDEGGRARKGVVDCADEVGVGEGFAS